MECQGCEKPLTGRQRMFCSIKCRNSANGKKVGGWNRNRVSRHCEWCGAIFEVPQYRASTARDCSLLCHNQRVSAETKSTGRSRGTNNGAWRNGRSPIYYRQFLKDACEWCESTKHLLVHHADENHENSDPSNLITLCKRCHQQHHDEGRRDPITGRYT